MFSPLPHTPPEIGAGGGNCPLAPADSGGHTSPTTDPCVCKGWPFVGGVEFVFARGAVGTAVLVGEAVGVFGVGVTPPRPPPRFPGEAAPCERVLRPGWELWEPFPPFCPFADIIR